VSKNVGPTCQENTAVKGRSPTFFWADTEECWANFSLLQQYSRRNALANLHLLCQPNTLRLAQDVFWAEPAFIAAVAPAATMGPA
jgi:hypothetical protein